MTQRHAGPRPAIHSPGTRRLAIQIRRLRRRQPDIDETIAAIHDGNQHVLHELIVQAQQGGADAALTAIWALLPRLTAVVINRLPVPEWREAMDDYLTFAYLTMIDVDTDEPREYLADKIIARTRRRYERAAEPQRATPSELRFLEAAAPVNAEVEFRVIARCDLAELIRAIHAGLLKESVWHNLLHSRFDKPPGAAATMQQRKALSRAQRRLGEWRSQAA